MINKKFVCLMALTITLAPSVVTQMQTEVPPAVPGAKPVNVERIKIHGSYLVGNLEGSAVAVHFQNYVMPFFNKHLCFEKNSSKALTLSIENLLALPLPDSLQLLADRGMMRKVS